MNQHWVGSLVILVSSISMCWATNTAAMFSVMGMVLGIIALTSGDDRE